jgi:hypothetical protein
MLNKKVKKSNAILEYDQKLLYVVMVGDRRNHLKRKFAMEFESKPWISAAKGNLKFKSIKLTWKCIFLII